MALMTVNDGEGTDVRSNNRWSASKKLDVVLRLLRGEKLEEISREVGVEAHRLAAWRDEFLDAGGLGSVTAGSSLMPPMSAGGRMPPWPGPGTTVGSGSSPS